MSALLYIPAAIFAFLGCAFFEHARDEVRLGRRGGWTLLACVVAMLIAALCVRCA